MKVQLFDFGSVVLFDFGSVLIVAINAGDVVRQPLDLQPKRKKVSFNSFKKKPGSSSNDYLITTITAIITTTTIIT